MSFFEQIKSVFNKKQEIVNTEQEIKNSVVIGEQPEPEVEIINASGSSFGSYKYSLSLESTSNNIKQLITEYRTIAKYPEIDEAINEITNEVIVQEGGNPVKLDIKEDEIKKNLKESIIEEFDKILSMLELKNKGDELFRQWYEDGRLYFQNVIDLEKPQEGIQDIKVLSPFNLKRVKEDGKNYFIYDDGQDDKVLKIPPEHITFIHSTLTDPKRDFYIGHLHKAIKPYNQLKLLEDSAIIYRFTRAPERRVFYIDVGKMNKSKAESYMAALISKFKNRITYDSISGKIDQQKNVMSMTEDFWLPSSETSGGSRGTRVDVLPGGQQLGEIEDIKYFNNKLKKSLNIPMSRFDSEEQSTMQFGNMNGELSRDEVRFSKFINKLRFNFGQCFFDILKKQLILKKIVTLDFWKEHKDSFELIWNSDSYFAEVKRSEIMKNRLELAEGMQVHVGKYFSNEFILKNVFQLTDEEIEEEKKKIEEELKDKIYAKSEEDSDY